MKFYKITHDIVRQDQYGEPELEDRITIYLVSDILLNIFYSDRYGEYFIKDHYGVLPVKSYNDEIKPSNNEMHGFINAIFKHED